MGDQVEDRFSFTQYIAGGVSRWVEYGCQKLETWMASATPEELAQKELTDGDRFKELLSMFSTVHELHSTLAAQV